MNQNHSLRSQAGARTASGIGRLATLLLLAACCGSLSGCAQLRTPEYQTDLAGFGDDYSWAAEKPDVRQLQEHLVKVQKYCDQLGSRLDKMDQLLRDRNEEIRQTRKEHAFSIKEVEMLRKDMNEWSASMSSLQDQLKRAERERNQRLMEVRDVISSMKQGA